MVETFTYGKNQILGKPEFKKHEVFERPRRVAGLAKRNNLMGLKGGDSDKELLCTCNRQFSGW